MGFAYDAEKARQGGVPNKEARAALVLLLHHLLVKNRYSHQVLFDLIFKHSQKRQFKIDPATGKAGGSLDRREAKKGFDNFLGKASVEFSEQIFDYLFDEMAKPGFYAPSPSYIQTLIHEAFGFRLDRRPLDSAIGETVDKITEEGRGYHKRVVAGYAGVWDVIRFSAHGEPGRPSSKDPKIMRAAMEIFETADEDEPARFEIHYRPGSVAQRSDYFTSRGSVLVLGRGEHMLFWGWEDTSIYPIYIVAKLTGARHDARRERLFAGLVMRRHEDTHIFSSRVLFARSDISLEKLTTDSVGMFRQSELQPTFEAEHPEIRDFEKMLEMILNEVGSGGMSGLWLPSSV